MAPKESLHTVSPFASSPCDCRAGVDGRAAWPPALALVADPLDLDRNVAVHDLPDLEQGSVISNADDAPRRGFSKALKRRQARACLDRPDGHAELTKR